MPRDVAGAPQGPQARFTRANTSGFRWPAATRTTVHPIPAMYSLPRCHSRADLHAVPRRIPPRASGPPPHIEEVLGTAIGPGDRNLRRRGRGKSSAISISRILVSWGRLPARVAEVQGSFQLTKPPAVSMFAGQRQDFVGDESRCHAERVEPRDGIIEPPAASGVECRTCRGGDRQSVDGVDLINGKKSGRRE